MYPSKCERTATCVTIQCICTCSSILTWVTGTLINSITDTTRTETGIVPQINHCNKVYTNDMSHPHFRTSSEVCQA